MRWKPVIRSVTASRTVYRLGESALNFIRNWEGTTLAARWDYHQWSIGHGTPSFEGEKITTQEAEARLREALKDYEKALDERLAVPVTEKQNTALLSALFNLGKRGLDTSDGSGVFDLVNVGDWQGAAEKLQQYCNAGGERHPGLVRRRLAESSLLLEGRLTGAPRIPYAREYWLMPPDATSDEFAQAATRAFKHKATIGFSADDAGIGALKKRTVLLISPERQPAEITEWFATHYPGVEVVPNLPSPSPAPQNGSQSVRKALVGLHGSADGSWGNPVLPEVQEMVRQGSIEAYKGLSNEDPETVDILSGLGVQFFMVRAFAKVNKEMSSAAEFAQSVLEQCKRWYDAGVQHIELHNEPNLEIEGMWGAWKDGSEFAQWWLRVRDALHKHLPDALFGYPGLSPSFSVPHMRYDPMRFIEESWEAYRAADWIGAHSYWRSEQEMWSEDGGQWFKRMPHDGVPLLITEFSNPGPEPAETKADQYIRWMASLDDVHSAYSFVATASSGFPAEVWSNTPIARMVGQRDGQGFVPTTA